MMTFATQERIDELRSAFNTLTSEMENWKDPIDTVIHINQLPEMREACEFFTGSTLYVKEQMINTPYMRVMADGYYIAIGA